MARSVRSLTNYLNFCPRTFFQPSHYARRARRQRIQGARRDEREGKWEFVREEMDYIQEGKHGARSPQQAIASNLSKARHAGVKLPSK